MKRFIVVIQDVLEVILLLMILGLFYICYGISIAFDTIKNLIRGVK